MSIIYIPAGNYNLKIPQSLHIVNTNKLYLLCETGGGDVTISLPELSTLPDYAKAWGFHIYITDLDQNASVNNITIVAPPSNTIGGAASVTMSSDGDVAELFISGYATWGYLLNATAAATNPLQSIFFSCIENQNDYVFDGTVTAWNPDGINLIGKSVPIYSSDGFIKTPTVNYNWIPATGTLSIIGQVYSDVRGGVFYQ